MVAGLVGRIRRPIPEPSQNSPPILATSDDARFHPIPLEGVNVTALVYDFSQQVTVEQLYTNTEEFPLEIKYVFPLAEGAAVVRFEAVFPEDTIRGIVKEKKQAKQEYEAAVAVGKQAALLEQDKTDTFTCVVGNLKPGERCTIRITTVAEIKMSPDGATQFILPMVVAPPYVPRGDVKPAASTAPRTETKAAAAVLPYRLSLNLDLWMPSPIKDVKGTHAVTIDKKSAINWQVSLAEGSAALDRDMVLNIEQEQPYGSRCVIERFVDKEGKSGWGGKSMAMQATFNERNMEIKEVMAGDLYCEMLFLVDISGSMAGSAMENTKNCLQIFLRSLPEKAIFNIILFESSYRSLFTQSQELSDESLNAATTFVAAIRATGGTELLPPLRHIFSQPPREGYPRQVFLLTDGQVSNTQQVIDLTKKNAAYARMFTFGLGSSVSRPLVQGLATAGGGEAEFVVENAKIATHVSAQLARALQPAISGISIDWGNGYAPIEASAPGGPTPSASATPTTGVTNAEVRQCPAVLPPIYTGGRYFIYGLIDKDNITFRDTFEIKLKAHFSNGGFKTISIPVVPGKNSREGSMIHKLAAKTRIKELEQSPSNDGNMTNGEILYLSLKYQVSSRLTSFVAVSDKAPPVNEPVVTPAQREVTLARTQSDDEDDEDEPTSSMSRRRVGGVRHLRQSTKSKSAAIPAGRGGSRGGGGGVAIGARNVPSARGGRAAPPTSTISAATASNSAQVDQVNRVMRENISMSLNRSEKLEDLSAKADTLESEARVFKKSAKSSNSGGILSSISNFFSGSKGKASASASPATGRVAAAASSSSSSASSPAVAVNDAMDNAMDEEENDASSDSDGGSGSGSSSPVHQRQQEKLRSSSRDKEKDKKEGARHAPMKRKKAAAPTSSASIARPSAVPPPAAPQAARAPAAPTSSARFSAVSPSSSVSSTAAPVGGASGGYQGLIQSQKFDGSWLLDVVISRGGATKTATAVTDAFTALLNTLVATVSTETKVEHKLQADEVTKETAALAGTLLALAMLETKFPDKRAEWMILMEKARAFIVKRLNRCITPTHDWDTRINDLIRSFATALAL